MNLRLEIVWYNLEIFTLGNFFSPSFLPYCWKANKFKRFDQTQLRKTILKQGKNFIHKIKSPRTFIKQGEKVSVPIYFNN